MNFRTWWKQWWCRHRRVDVVGIARDKALHIHGTCLDCGKRVPPWLSPDISDTYRLLELSEASPGEAFWWTPETGIVVPKKVA